MRDPILIIGAGQAAVQAVASLRAGGCDEDILVFGDERYLPYQRPPLSKAFLAGETTPERLELRPASYYAELGVDLRLGQRVQRIDARDQLVETAAGRFRFSRLLVATGTRARRLPLPGAEQAGVHHIRAIPDVEAFRSELSPGARAVIIGGGYVGLEVAAKARKLGLDVTVVETQERILSRVVCPETAEAVAALHRRHGVILRTGAGVTALRGRDRLESVELTDGAILPADVALIAAGALPNMELAAEAGIATGNGVLVDAQTRTSLPNIYAAGDIACFPSRLFGRRLRLESVPNAIDMAKAAAAALMGEAALYDPVPWFWSDQYDTKLQIAGLAEGYDRVETLGEAGSGPFSVRYMAGGRLLAVDSLNDPKGHVLARRALAGSPAAGVAA